LRYVKRNILPVAQQNTGKMGHLQPAQLPQPVPKPAEPRRSKPQPQSEAETNELSSHSLRLTKDHDGIILSVQATKI
jgi:hypothetical protein